MITQSKSASTDGAAHVYAGAESAADNKRGILLMVFAMAAFAIEDAFIKMAGSLGMSAAAILLWLGFGGTIIFSIYASMRGIKVWTQSFFNPYVMARNAAEAGATFCFITSLTLLPLSLATTILQTVPLIVTAAAALILGEKVGWRRWLAVAVGFLGVLLVIQPTQESFSPLALWAIAAAIGLAIRDIVTRKVPKSIETMQLMVWAYAAIGFVGLGLVASGADWGGTAQPAAWGWIVGMLAIGAVSYWALTEATRIGELSVVAPFRYSRLVFGVAIGVMIFGERLDYWAIIGGALIIAAGLYAFHRERVRSRQARQDA
jgi:drug/metabolite transporter (DMT)-like permease